MNTKKIVIAAAVLGIAVLVLVLVNVVGNRKPSERSLLFYPGLSEKAIGAVVLKDASDWVKLQRKGDQWFMIPKKVLEAQPAGKPATGIDNVMGSDSAAPAAVLSSQEYPADSSTVRSLLDNVVKMKKDILVSENPDKQAIFEVDTSKGILLDVLDLEGKSMGRVILGKNAADWSSNYVRSENAIAVYQAQGISRYVFGTEQNRWTDKTVMKFDKAAVTQVSIARKGAPALIVALEGDSVKTWNITAPVKKSADSTKVGELLNGLSNLVASEYEQGALSDAETGLADPAFTVSVTFKSGSVKTVVIGNQKPGDTKFWAMATDKPYRYLINDSEQKKVDKKADDFLAQELKPIEAVPAMKSK